jgi:hypothetical protein
MGDCADALAERAIADLVVGLREDDKRGRRQIRRYFAARFPAAKVRALALVGKPFSQRAPEIPQRPLRVIRVVTVALPGCNDVQRMMKIVVPLRVGGERPLAAIAAQEARFVAIVLEYEVNMAVAPGP